MDIETLKQKTGTLLGSSGWYAMTQDRINQFATVTEDEQFIHIDKERAAASPFGTTIAHGFLTLSLLPAMGKDVIPELDGHLMSVNYGFEKLRFLSPVPSGARVRGHFTLTSLEERKQHLVEEVKKLKEREAGDQWFLINGFAVTKVESDDVRSFNSKFKEP